MRLSRLALDMLLLACFHGRLSRGGLCPDLAVGGWTSATQPAGIRLGGCRIIRLGTAPLRTVTRERVWAVGTWCKARQPRKDRGEWGEPGSLETILQHRFVPR